MTNFNALGISKEILFNLKNLGLITPTPIQKEAIIPVLEGKDILANAKTGTGKTAAFGIPLIQKLKENKQVTSVILTPTRELALQVDKHLKDLMGNNTKVKSLVIIGGESIQKQIKLIRNKPQLIIGTPGRICDHLNKGTLDLNRVSYLVLDETDRMLDLGFSIQIKKILKYYQDTCSRPYNLHVSMQHTRLSYQFEILNSKVIILKTLVLNQNHEQLHTEHLFVYPLDQGNIHRLTTD